MTRRGGGRGGGRAHKAAQLSPTRSHPTCAPLTPSTHPTPRLRSGTNLFATWRGRHAIDGSITVDHPLPAGVGYSVIIQSQPPGMSEGLRTGTGLGGVIREVRPGGGRCCSRALRRKGRVLDKHHSGVHTGLGNHQSWTNKT